VISTHEATIIELITCHPSYDEPCWSRDEQRQRKHGFGRGCMTRHDLYRARLVSPVEGLACEREAGRLVSPLRELACEGGALVVRSIGWRAEMIDIAAAGGDPYGLCLSLLIDIATAGGDPYGLCLSLRGARVRD